MAEVTSSSADDLRDLNVTFGIDDEFYYMGDDSVDGWCSTEVTQFKILHKWTIDNFRNFMEEGIKDELESASFSMMNGELEWRIRLILNSADREYQDYMSLALSLVSSKHKEISVKSTFSVLNSKQELSMMNGNYPHPMRFNQHRPLMRLVNFIRKDVLLNEEKGLLPNGKLSIFCHIRVVLAVKNVFGPRIAPNVIPCDLAEQFYDIIHSPKHWDTSLMVKCQDGYRTFYAHKALLSCRSRTFARWFEQDGVNNRQNGFRIDFCDVAVMEKVLIYIYTGVSEVADNPFNILLQAIYFDLEGLTVCCLHRIYETITIENVARILEFAGLNLVERLKLFCIRFITTQASRVTETTGWAHLVSSSPRLVPEVYHSLATYPIVKIPDRPGHTHGMDSWCNTNANVDTVEFSWTIDNFSFSHENGTLTSSSFSSEANNALKWCLRLHPNGFNEESRGYVSLYLMLLSTNLPKVKAKYRFSFIDAERKHRGLRVSPVVSTFKKGWDWGYKMFMSRAELMNEASELLPNDKLVIHCAVSVISNPTHLPGECYFPPCPPVVSLSESMKVLYDKQLDADIILKVPRGAEYQEFAAHKWVLASRSSVFAATIEGISDSQRKPVVLIENINPLVMAEVLAYIYCGKCNVEVLPSEILAASVRFELERLQNLCELHYFSKLEIDNVLETLVIADLNSAEQLKKFCVDLIKKQMLEVTETSGWNDFVRNHSHLLAELYRTLAVN